MRKYEITFLTTGEADSSKVRDIISKIGGKVEKEEKMGKKPLAYEIKKHKELFYFTFVFSIDPKKIAELKQKLNFEEVVVRYLILKVEE